MTNLKYFEMFLQHCDHWVAVRRHKESLGFDLFHDGLDLFEDDLLRRVAEVIGQRPMLHVVTQTLG